MGKDSQTNILDQDEDFSVECSAALPGVGGLVSYIISITVLLLNSS